PGQKLPPNARRFPAILDTGHNHTLAISEQQLREWVGWTPQAAPLIDHIRVRGHKLPVVPAHIWICRNRPGKRDEILNGPPFCVELGSGIAVFPDGTPGTPRLPLLGLRALRSAGLHLTVNCRRGLVTLRTPWR